MRVFRVNACAPNKRQEIPFENIGKCFFLLDVSVSHANDKRAKIGTREARGRLSESENENTTGYMESFPALQTLQPYKHGFHLMRGVHLK